DILKFSVRLLLKSRPHANMRGAAATIGPGDTVHRGLELPQGGRARSAYWRRPQWERKCPSAPDRLRQIWVFVGVVRYHQHERGQLRLNGANGLCQFHGTERAVILEIPTVDNAIDNLVLAVTDFARRGNDRETRGIMRRRA